MRVTANNDTYVMAKSLENLAEVLTKEIGLPAKVKDGKVIASDMRITIEPSQLLTIAANMGNRKLTLSRSGTKVKMTIQ